MHSLPHARSRLHWLACSLLTLATAFAQSVSSSTQTSPSAADSPEEKIELSPFVVTSDADVGYESLQTTSGLRTVQSLRNVANSISVANAQLIQDTGSLTIEELSKWFVTGESNPDPTNVVGTARQIFRGIQSNYSIRNGWVWYSPIDSYSTDRVELLRGPNAFLYGEADLGGAQNQITKRGLFNRDFTRFKFTGGSNDLLRGEIDVNRRLGRTVAVRLAAVQSHNRTWWDHGFRDFRGLYGAISYQPFEKTRIHLLGEIAQSRQVLSQGLFADAFSSTSSTTYANTGGVAYIPATGASYRLAGRRVSSGPGVTIVNPAIVPKEAQFNGPHAVYRPDQRTVTLEIEQRIGSNLVLQFSGNWYYQQWHTWGASSRSIFRDLNPTLPSGAPNPYFNELYTEYYRTYQFVANTVRDARLSAVYDWKPFKWMAQQFIANVQQHQDNPGAKFPKMGEYVSPTNPAFLGAINNDPTTAGLLANRATFTNNRFVRRFYLKDGDRADLTGSLGPVPGLSDYFPDFSNAVSAAGAQINRRFYTPSKGVGAAGTYFNEHLHTLVGYREDEFKMKTTSGVPSPLANTWQIDAPNELISAPQYVYYKFHGTNYGAVLRINPMLAFAANYAKSYRLSVGDGNDGYIVGTKQGIMYGEGWDMGVRLSFLGGRIELNSTYYDNYQPNARITPLGTVQQNVKDELSAIFPATFNVNGSDLQKTTTNGIETELVANLSANWRVMLNVATNKVVTEDRLVQLKSFQAEAKAQNRPTPLLDAFLLTFPEGVPNAGYTKTRLNFFTRYQFNRGALKGAYVGGGTNTRDKTFRGNAVLNGVVTPLWSPSYTVATLLAGYQTKLFNRTTTFALNVDNVFDKEYYRSAALGSGSWGEPRSFRLSAIVDF